MVLMKESLIAGTPIIFGVVLNLGYYPAKGEIQGVRGASKAGPERIIVQ